MGPSPSSVPVDDFSGNCCGVDWASSHRGRECAGGLNSECPTGEACFSGHKACGGSVATEVPSTTPQPTAPPHWVQPTSSPTTATSLPAPSTTMPPTAAPTESTIAPPTLAPTLQATQQPPVMGCSGVPCADATNCRSQWGYCGSGSSYCNDMATWTSTGCGNGQESSVTTTAAPATSPAGGAGAVSFSRTKWWQGCECGPVSWETTYQSKEACEAAVCS